ncbi:hypothetical protein [Roseiterribacter gracilis]|uniref:Uncharacterized protein n=1 Tax=Roseiterribacter gracilis TaxID=2812848 RepID=A0A8S8XFG8_9PROT|nr:hypothetical protein TMPK1_21120 [Rhodospirillales bacterium TMPK1]
MATLSALIFVWITSLVTFTIFLGPLLILALIIYLIVRSKRQSQSH